MGPCVVMPRQAGRLPLLLLAIWLCLGTTTALFLNDHVMFRMLLHLSGSVFPWHHQEADLHAVESLLLGQVSVILFSAYIFLLSVCSFPNLDYRNLRSHGVAWTWRRGREKENVHLATNYIFKSIKWLI